MAAVAVPGADEEGIEPQQEYMDCKLLKALQKGDAIFVRRFLSQGGHRSWRGVTVGGNSALHIVADFGHPELAEFICDGDSSLLAARNAALETPLHCAARAGSHRIVSLFITVGWQDGGRRLEEVLRAKDREGKTALYTAAQEGHAAAARVLMSADPGLAAIVDSKGVSPLYVAVLSGSLEIVQILTGSRADGGDTPEASYAGPNGQTALHAAAMIENTNSKGLCPVHVAAMMRRSTIISELINSCPDMFELVDSGGRNFLHVAIQHKQEKIVKFVCGKPLLLKMMNARDSEGNTPLHLAVKSKNQTIVSLLLKNKSVHPSIVNQNGETPLDLATAGLDFGLYLRMNPGMWIFQCLKGIGAIYGPHRSDLLVDEMTAELDQEKELKKYETTTQSLAVVSVLIATVTFAAAFTMPGGYKADDHQNGGTPTLATKYAFKAFICSDSLAFIYSIMATIWLMYAGSLTTDPSLRMKFILGSTSFLYAAAHGLVIAFTMAVYVVLTPVNSGMTISICLLSFTSILFYGSPDIWQAYRLASMLRSRQGWLRMHKIRVASRPSIEDDEGNIYYSIFLHLTLYFAVYFFAFI